MKFENDLQIRTGDNTLFDSGTAIIENNKDFVFYLGAFSYHVLFENNSTSSISFSPENDFHINIIVSFGEKTIVKTNNPVPIMEKQKKNIYLSIVAQRLDDVCLLTYNFSHDGFNWN